jgi:hypothetical protein
MQYHPAKGGKGKQHGSFSSFLDITRSEFHKIIQKSRGERLLLLFRTFCHVVYATTGFILTLQGLLIGVTATPASWLFRETRFR